MSHWLCIVNDFVMRLWKNAIYKHRSLSSNSWTRSGPQRRLDATAMNITKRSHCPTVTSASETLLNVLDSTPNTTTWTHVKTTGWHTYTPQTVFKYEGKEPTGTEFSKSHRHRWVSSSTNWSEVRLINIQLRGRCVIWCSIRVQK